jgi:hypothetical protein
VVEGHRRVPTGHFSRRALTVMKIQKIITFRSSPLHRWEKTRTLKTRKAVKMGEGALKDRSGVKKLIRI